jgi:hypothetical protein
MVPGCHGNYYLSLPPAGKDGPVTICAVGQDKPVVTLEDLDLRMPKEVGITNDFTFDKRVHLIPEARLVITIPVTDDRLVLHRFRR